MSPSITITSNSITTDDISFSAFLKMKGYPLIKLDHKSSKCFFVFDIENKDAHTLKMEFINSEFVNYHNQLRSLKKLI